MEITFVLAVAIFIAKSCSQILTTDRTCYAIGGELKLNCETIDISKTITFSLNGTDKGGCSFGSCAPTMTQSGTTTTITLTPFSSATHSGNWTCSYDLSVSSGVIVAENPCVETTMGPKEGKSQCEEDKDAIYILVFMAVGLSVVDIIAFVLICRIRKPYPRPGNLWIMVFVLFVSNVVICLIAGGVTLGLSLVNRNGFCIKVGYIVLAVLIPICLSALILIYVWLRKPGSDHPRPVPGSGSDTPKPVPGSDHPRPVPGSGSDTPNPVPGSDPPKPVPGSDPQKSVPDKPPSADDHDQQVDKKSVRKKKKKAQADQNGEVLDTKKKKKAQADQNGEVLDTIVPPRSVDENNVNV